MQRNYFKIVSIAISLLVLLIQRIPKLSLVFWDVFIFFWLGSLCHLMILFITVEISDMTQVFARCIGIRRIAIYRLGSRVFLSLLII